MLKILAALIFFTRLPFWKLGEVPASHFKNIVSHWALIGWLTSGLMFFVFYVTCLFLPVNIALLTAIITRLLVTGYLHEDCLADFLDGFGGGHSRERILSIMKDSHIGSCIPWSYPSPCSNMVCTYLLHEKKNSGYTGDCCGATFLCCELSFYLGIVIINYNLV